MNKAAWLAFWTLGLIWGSSFLLIRIGVEEISPTQVVLFRTTIAALGLNLVRHLRNKKIPPDWPTLRALLIIGVGNATVPYTLISVSEQYISSGMAAVLQATASLFTLVVAHFVFSDERINRKKIIGLATGFTGVFVLSSTSFDGGEFNSKMFLGQMGMAGASLFYAIFTVYSRTVIKKKIEPIVVSSTTFIASAVAAVIFAILEPILGGRAFTMPWDMDSDVLMAVVLLGFLNTFLAYLMYYFLVRELGAFRTSMVTYVVPVVGLILGALVLDESISPNMFAGALLIFSGIAIINIHPAALFNMRKRLRNAT